MRTTGLLIAAACGAGGALYMMQVGLPSLPLTWAEMREPGSSANDAGISEIAGWDGAPATYPVDDGREHRPITAPGLTQHTAPTPNLWNALSEWKLGGPSAAHPGDVVASTISNRNTRTAGTAQNTPWAVIGQSAQGQSLHIRRVGAGEKVTLVVAGIDGEDRIAVNWIDSFAKRLDEEPETFRDHQLVLLRAVNPDGLINKKLENSRGVALNRNFPTGNYRPGGQPSAGKGPASEPETRVVMQLLFDLRPQRVVHVVSTPRRSTAECNGVATEASASLSTIRSLTVKDFDAKEHPGSLEDFVTSVLGSEVVTLRLGVNDDWRSAAITHFPTLIAASVPQVNRGGLTATTEEETATDPTPFRVEPEEGPRLEFDADSASADANKVNRLLKRPKRTGFEELPPPKKK